MPKREHLLSHEQAIEVLCYLDRAEIDLSSARKKLEQAEKDFQASCERFDKLHTESVKIAEKLEELRKVVDVIENNAAEMCDCRLCTETETFESCVACKFYSLAHAVGDCHSGCPVRRNARGKMGLSEEPPSEKKAVSFFDLKNREEEV